jgi:hypothetical protein
MSSRRKLVVPFIVPLLIGLGGFSNVARSPRFETFHTVDVIQLIGTGMCFGVALYTLVIFLRGPRSG